jgi:hypothetical protein
MPNLIQLVQGTEQVLPTAMIRYMVVVLAYMVVVLAR